MLSLCLYANRVPVEMRQRLYRVLKSLNRKRQPLSAQHSILYQPDYYLNAFYGIR